MIFFERLVMSNKLKQILSLALHPNTSEGESSAAFSAARRLIAKHGIEALDSIYSEKVVHQEKVKYRKPNHTHKVSFTIEIPAIYHHNIIEHIFKDAEELQCDVSLISCKPKNQTVISGTVISFVIMGSKQAVAAYSQIISIYIDHINQKRNKTPSDSQPKNTDSQPKNTDSKPKNTDSKPKNTYSFKEWFLRLFVE